MQLELEPTWKNALKEELSKPYFSVLKDRVTTAYSSHLVFPRPENVFRALELCPIDRVKVVILGQDPYHGPDQAHGLSFSVPEGIRIPPSLRNIYKEIESDLGTPPAEHGDLTRWAEQGVLLLNATLTVEAAKAGSHQGWGWERFTDAIIERVSSERAHVVFLLWGTYAAQKSALIDGSKHLVLKAPHPSPLSAHRGFFGCRHFSRANEYLERHGQKTIDW